MQRGYRRAKHTSSLSRPLLAGHVNDDTLSAGTTATSTVTSSGSVLGKHGSYVERASLITLAFLDRQAEKAFQRRHTSTQWRKVRRVLMGLFVYSCVVSAFWLKLYLEKNLIAGNAWQLWTYSTWAVPPVTLLWASVVHTRWYRAHWSLYTSALLLLVVCVPVFPLCMVSHDGAFPAVTSTGSAGIGGGGGDGGGGGGGGGSGDGDGAGRLQQVQGGQLLAYFCLAFNPLIFSACGLTFPYAVLVNLLFLIISMVLLIELGDSVHGWSRYFALPLVGAVGCLSLIHARESELQERQVFAYQRRMEEENIGMEVQYTGNPFSADALLSWFRRDGASFNKLDSERGTELVVDERGVGTVAVAVAGTGPGVGGRTRRNSALRPGVDGMSSVSAAALRNWEIPATELTLLDRIGKGGSGQVFRGLWSGHHEVACKEMFAHLVEDSFAELSAELGVLANVHHANIVRFYGISKVGKHVYLVTQLHPCSLSDALFGSKTKKPKARGNTVIPRAHSDGDLAGNADDVVPGHRTRMPTLPAVPALPSLSPAVKRKLVLQVAEAMLYLHSRSPVILHRDLKPANVLLDDKLNAQVCDFGLSRFLVDADGEMNTQTSINVGTWSYMAPEAIIGQTCPAPIKLDVYSFAVLANATFSGARPYRQYSGRRSKFQMMQHIVDGERPELDPAKFASMLQEVCVQRPMLAVTRSSGDSHPGGGSGLEGVQPLRPLSTLTCSSRATDHAAEVPSKPEPAMLWAQRMCDLIGRCWDAEPAVRPTFECIVQDLKRAERELFMGDSFCSVGHSTGEEELGRGGHWGSAPSKGFRLPG